MNTQWKDEFYGPPVPIPTWVLAAGAFAGLFVILRLLDAVT
ncbi:MAG TPA: hypothetical protein VHM90_15755 [Phycisphaerae bacterium]|jgi:hypothetical protein|nr:hypothetical protein [Phycisphaerae bacterium]